MEPCEMRTPMALLQSQVENLEGRVAGVEKIHEVLNAMNMNLAEVKAELKNVCGAVQETKGEQKAIKEDVQALQMAPAKKFDKLELAAITALVLYAIQMILNIPK